MRLTKQILIGSAAMLLAVGCETSGEGGGNLNKNQKYEMYADVVSSAMPKASHYEAYADEWKGDKIPDFSRVGYRWGDKSLPNYDVVVTIEAPENGSDATELIQNAITEASEKGGGAVLLKAGTYNVENTIRLNKSNVVLRGEGSEDGSKSLTKLYATKKAQYTLVIVGGVGNRTINEAGLRTIKDEHVPCGAMSFSVSDASIYSVGESIAIRRYATQDWINALRMNDPAIGTVWTPGYYSPYCERVITHIDGNTIHIENPIVMQLNEKYGKGVVYKCSYEDLVTESGIENIYFESYYNKAITDTSTTDKYDEKHGWEAVKFAVAHHCWLRDSRAKYFGYSLVNISSPAKNITVSNCRNEDPISDINGGRRYSFNINNGSLSLVIDCTDRLGRHAFITNACGVGPNAFVNCKTVDAKNDCGPHHRWNVGTLYDNISTDGSLRVQNRWDNGSGHGWTGGNQVMWNVNAASVLCQNPEVSAYNYMIGCTGGNANPLISLAITRAVSGITISRGTNVLPKSLYYAQLELRRKIQPGGVMDVSKLK